MSICTKPSGGFALREYQHRAVASVRSAFMSGCRSVVMVMPTGAGKSVVFGEIIRLAVEKGSTVLWLVHRRNLVLQMKATLERFGVPAGVIMAGVDSDTNESVQVGTIQTYARRLQLDSLDRNRFFINADLVMVDEAHRVCSKQYKDVLDLYREKRVVGCTATPCRADGRGLGEVFERIVDVVGVADLTANGYLAPAKYYVPSEPDLREIRIVRGDYDVKELGKRTNTPKLVGDVVENWLRLAEGLPTIVFAVNVKHSIALRDEFRKRGINAEHLDARSTDDERDFVFGEVERGRVSVVCNVAVYQEGLDVPGISCVVMARPTKSLGLYRQSCGRGLRPQMGKTAIIIDHGGVVAEHGFLDEPVYWTLDGKERAWKKPKRDKKQPRPVKCNVCAYVFTGGNVCPECGSPVKSFGKPVDAVDAELVEARPDKVGIEEKRRYLGMLKWWQANKNKNPKIINAKYRNRFGCWPHHTIKDVSPIRPDEAFWNRLKYDAIRWQKSQQRQVAE
jgi:superfamily II DNA or RNA helicase